METTTPDPEADESNFTPRPYQDQLLEFALKRNTIIYLPTGAGKTFIALMAMKRMSDVLTRPLAQGGKRSVFLVNTVVLAHQQRLSIQKATALKVAVYTGDMNVDCWRKDRWLEEFENNQVLVATCQIILDVIRHGMVSFQHINLIIFDECHHGRKEHVMHQLMQLYNETLLEHRPRVIGLTGMLISGSIKPQNVIEELNSLESAFNAVISTVRSYKELNNVLVYSTHPMERIIRFQDISSTSPNTTDRVELLVGGLVKTIESWPIDATHQKITFKMDKKASNSVSYLRSLLKDFVYQMKDLGLYGASIAILSVIIELELKKRTCETFRSRQLLRILITAAERISNIIIHEIYDDEEVDHEPSTILSNSSPKIINFILFLQDHIKNHDISDMKALIFVQRRHSAKNVFHIVKHFAENDPNFGIRADFMVGNNSTMPESIESVLENKWNRDVVNKFRRNELNLIVASSVLEEGIDLQMCNLVVSLDAPMSFRSYVQSKGRARMSSSTYVIMCSFGEFSNMTSKLREYQEVDRVLKEYLIEKAIDRTQPLRQDVDREFNDFQRLKFTTKRGAILEEMSAVSLLNRYCSTLPNDSFTLSTVNWSKVNVVNSEKGSPIMLAIRIRLPMQSTVKEEIEGEPRGSLKEAKRAAAFRACIRLYENKELNENLMPINAKRCIESVKPVYFKHWDQYVDDNGRLAGTNKNKRIHRIEYPDAIINCAPSSKGESFLYPIQMTPEFEQSDMHAEMHTLLSSHRSFAILTSKPLPKLTEMKLFFTFGRVGVRIDSQPIRIDSVESVKLLRTFHTMLFREVLRTSLSFMVDDLRNEENSYLIVPILDGVRIDWLTVQSFQHIEPVQALKDRSEMQFKPDDYLHKVIHPWYRLDTDQRYVVTKVHQNLTPNSPFPSDIYKTYADYFKKQYNMRIFHPNQFLLEVRGITQQLNRLHQGQNQDGSKNQTTRGPEILIPELCFNFGFPGDLWLKATLLPSILHRIHYMLHAESLRITLNRVLGVKPNQTDEFMLPVLWEKYGGGVPAQSKPISGTVVKIEPQSALMENPWGDLCFEETSTEQSLDTSCISDPFGDFVDIFEDLEICPPTSSTKLKTAKQIDMDDCISFPWKDYVEPQDMSRNIDSIYSVDFQYFDSFVSEFESKCNMSLALNNADPLDIPIEPEIDENLKRIDLLLITPTTPSRGLEQRDLLAAITSTASADVFDGERLEVLGDAFLKFSASVFLLQRHPKWHEGFLTTCKGQMVSNRNLYYLGNELVASKIKVCAFAPKATWQPPLMCVPSDLKAILKENDIAPQVLNHLVVTDDEFKNGCLSRDRLSDFIAPFLGQKNPPEKTTSTSMYNFLDQQNCDDKRIADTIEAILGACVTSMGIDRSFNVLKFLGVFPDNDDYTKLLKRQYTQPRLRTNIQQQDIDGFLPNYQQLERNLGYTFKDRGYLLQALTHPSFPTNSVTGCYQQLEFLGDAVLDMMVSAYIYERCPQMHQGKLTDLRSALVNNNTLACLCVRNQFHRYILSQNALLVQQIAAFSSFQRSQEHRITEQVLLLIGDGDVMGEHIDVPKTLGDVFEALIGAVFLDSGNDLSVTWSVIYRLMHNEIALFMAHTPLQVVRQLYEFKNAYPKFDAPYVEDDVVMVAVRFTCNNQLMQALGFGRNSKDAKNAAAKVALSNLYAQL